MSARQLYRRLYRELSFQSFEASLIQQAEAAKRAKLKAQYLKKEYEAPKPRSASKRIAAAPLYDSHGLRDEFLNHENIAYGQEVLGYLKAQRTYKELFSRYNGKDFEDEERLRLTARRVGLELPIKKPITPSN